MSAATKDDARLRKLLDERSALLARRGLDAEIDGARIEYLVCACGGDHVGIRLSEITRVIPARACTPVPDAPAAFRGIIAVSGAVVSVIDLAAALGLPRSEPAATGGHLLRIRAQDPPVVLAVDRVLGIASIAEAAADAADGAGLGGDVILGYAAPGSARGLPEGFSILDARKLLRRYLA